MLQKIAIETFGCKLNFAESSYLIQSFDKNKFQIVDTNKEADFYIVHSCAVTKNAEKKVRNSIRQYHRKYPNAKIIVIGCYAELAQESLDKIEGISLTLKNKDKYCLADFLCNFSSEKKENFLKKNTDNDFFPLYSSVEDRTRLFFKVQEGCDYFCSYCTIPLARHRSRSASIKETMKVFYTLVEEYQAQEIVLTGINLGDFGRKNGETLHDLLTEMAASKLVPRIRLSSVEPDLMTEEIIQLIKKESCLMPHFHLPLQASTDKILASMRRRYSTSFFKSLLEKIRKEIPDAYISSDILCGFPGETQEIFEDGLSFIKELDINDMHVFSFSERPQTKAAELENKIPAIEKNRRSKILRAIANEKKQAFIQQAVNKKHLVLFEKEESNMYLYGFTENYLRVKIKYNKDYSNSIIPLITSSPDADGVLTIKEICIQD
jgi:threonylcarbamoyladenosine tRNA methylthiotransferase MtaB